MEQKGKLVLLRHAKSVWNQKNIFTGWVNVGLSEEGIHEALSAGDKIKDYDFDVVFVSDLVRAHMTAFIALSRSNSRKTPVLLYPEKKPYQDWHNVTSSEVALLPIYATSALNERYYGKLQGQNKEEIKQKYGEDQFKLWRRSYDTAPPEGESLKMTIERALPFYDEVILPRLARNETVLVCAHGNSLRGIVMEIEKLSPADVALLEIPTGEPLEYSYKEGKYCDLSR